MIGIDVVDLARFRRALERSPRLPERLFTESELAYCRAKSDPVLHMAGTLAAKEAVIKVFGLGPLAGWSRRIEITRAPSGAPHARVEGRSCVLSISHDGPVAVAVALASHAPVSG